MNHTRRALVAGLLGLSLALGRTLPSMAADPQCFGDCNENGFVSVNEALIATNFSLGHDMSGYCPLTIYDFDESNQVEINELVAITKNATSTECPSSFTPGPPQATGAFIALSQRYGSPGETVDLTATLHTGGASVAATRQDFFFNPGIGRVVSGSPVCQRNSALNKNNVSPVSLPIGCTPGTDCNGVRLIVIELDPDNVSEPIPDGSVLFTCLFDISPTAMSGPPFSLAGGPTTGSDGAGNLLVMETRISVCGDGVFESVEACDDGNTVDGDGCDSNCTPTGCGNGVISSGEECDDGNQIDNDGCQSDCSYTPTITPTLTPTDTPTLTPTATPTLTPRRLFKGEQSCVNSMNAAGLKVAKAQGKLNADCRKEAAILDGTDVLACLADAGGRVAGATAKVGAIASYKCAPAPPFGFTAGLDVSNAAIQETRASMMDLFGSPISILSASSSGATCQAGVLKATQNLLVAESAVFLRCKKSGLSGRTALMISTSDLEGCFDTLASDVASSTGKIGSGLAKLDAAVAACGSEANTALPGVCTESPDISSCIAERVQCRVCRLFNAMDGLSEDCDQFDDGIANASCP